MTYEVKGLPCEAMQDDRSKGCGSSDAMALYCDEDSYRVHCFSCGKSSKVTEERGAQLAQMNPLYEKYKKQGRKPPKDMIPEDFTQGAIGALTDRGIPAEVCAKFNVRRQTAKGSPHIVVTHLYPYHDAKGDLVAQKIRVCKKAVRDSEGKVVDWTDVKTFPWEGDATKVTLFGQSVFPSGGLKLTITEGELDALSAFYMNGQKYPVVSIPNGAQSVRLALQNPVVYEYIDSFKQIYLSFDMDGAGQESANVIAEAFPTKTFIMKMRNKDANEYVMKKDFQGFVQDFHNAKIYTPAGIILGSELADAVEKGESFATAVPFPFKGVDHKLFGIREGEITVITAGTGIGKSAIVREVAIHLFKNTDSTIGYMMLEESNIKSGTGLTGILMNKNLILMDLDRNRELKDRFFKETDYPKAEERKAAVATVLRSNRFVLYKNAFSNNSIDTIVQKVRQMVSVYGCKYVMLDHISIIVSAQDNGDERKALDEIITKLRNLVEETGIHLFIVSHLKRPQGKGHEEGATTSISELRGTAAIGQLADNVLGLERNQQSPDEYIANTTLLRVLKCRITGITGIGSYINYNLTTGRCSEISEEEYNKRLTDAEGRSITKDNDKDIPLGDLSLGTEGFPQNNKLDKEEYDID